MQSAKHTIELFDTWSNIKACRNSKKIVITGDVLDIASVVAVARYGCVASLDEGEETCNKIAECAKFLDTYLEKGYNVYGVNTGFGGSADTRTKDHGQLQSSLLQLTQSGILPTRINKEIHGDNKPVNAMPTSWTRATMLVRVNSLARGHSAVRLETLRALLKLVYHNMNPIIPLRGSISASGDLMPLAYIAGTLEGSPDIYVKHGSGDQAKVVSATDALKIMGLSPITLGPKEGLGILNGTALSAAVASLASYEANQLALLSQLLIAMSCEAQRGNADNWHPFIAQIRPHPGQHEAAHNIRSFLKNSKLAVFAHDRFRDGLCQDRYPLRTSSQWIGPQLEDLMLAAQQISTELNSTTDNPIIDITTDEVISGGNFQAVSITSASEKIRTSMQMIGKVLACLCSELINPATNNGLPPNLCADDPSLSFTTKGIDINIAAYMSELAYLAHPVSSHVQSAEMHNQAINSLAFLTTRYTMKSIKLVQMISAAHLYVLCQALDLRVLHTTFLTQIQPLITQLTTDHFPTTTHQALSTFPHLPLLTTIWSTSSTLDLTERAKHLVDSLLPHLLPLLSGTPPTSISISTTALKSWQTKLVTSLIDLFVHNLRSFTANPTTPNYLSTATRALYNFVRQDLKVPFHRGAVEHPKPESSDKAVPNGEVNMTALGGRKSGNGSSTIDGREKRMVGSWVSVVYEAVSDGRLDEVVMGIVKECGLVDGDVEEEKVKARL